MNQDEINAGKRLVVIQVLAKSSYKNFNVYDNIPGLCYDIVYKKSNKTKSISKRNVYACASDFEGFLKYRKLPKGCVIPKGVVLPKEYGLERPQWIRVK